MRALGHCAKSCKLGFALTVAGQYFLEIPSQAVITGLKGPVHDRAFAGVHPIKINTWSFGTINAKQFRSVQLSKIKRLSNILPCSRY